MPQIFFFFLIRNTFEAKQHCPEIKKNYAISEQVQVKSIILNMSFWKNWKLTFHIKYLIEEGNLWIFVHVVSHLNCSRSITGTSASTLLPLNSPSPTPRLTRLKHWSAISLIISPKLKTLSKWLFTSERMCPLSIHPNGPLQTHLISTF